MAEDRRDGQAGVPPAAVAFALLDRAPPPGGLLLVTAGERRAAAIAGLLEALAPARAVLHFPRRDVLPFERVPPSAEVMGRRVAVLRRLCHRDDAAPIVVAAPEAVLPCVPPCAALDAAAVTLSVGDALDLEALKRLLVRTGWRFDERVDEPGEAAVRGRVIDLHPAVGGPVRIEHDDGRVSALHAYDPVSQRTTGDLDRVDIAPVSEAILPDTGAEEIERPEGIEQRLAALYGGCASLFDAFTGEAVLLEPGVRERLARPPGDDDALVAEACLEPAAIETALARRHLEEFAPDATALPRFALAGDPAGALRRRAAAALEAGRTVLLAAPDDGDLARMIRMMRRPVRRVEPGRAGDAAPGEILAARLDLDAGFEDGRRLVVTARDVYGSRARRAGGAGAGPAAFGDEPAFRVGDIVVHLDHGIARLDGLETVDAGGIVMESLRLGFADGASRLFPVAGIGQLFRYGGDEAAVTLDKADGKAWLKRRAKAEAEIAAAAEAMAEAAARRAAIAAPVIRPPAAAYERFVARFPYPESPDQEDAIAAVLDDLAAGRPMDRLVTGDVGFGKTEVALRAAAAVALSGRQVAIVAPTTVLARQHEETVRRRFEGLGVTVAALSRFTPPAEARRVRAGLADGSIGVVVGTHAVAGKGVAFSDLGLMVIDEEQRFGAAQKAAFRRLAEGRHVLALTATPIPRTLQGALAGLVDLSVIATPPGPRRPVRTVVAPFDLETVAEALRRERARGGQSFVVCPRIEDMAGIQDILGRIVPGFGIVVLHAGLKPEAIDRAILGFGRGEGDVLLATSIVETGLDLPRANTMVVWHADRFGLAQLHQLRGRVGRGRRQATVYLTTDPETAPGPAAEKRLATLASLDRLGAGFDIAARDLDQRGGGALVGDAQAGHLGVIGAGLARHLFEQALRAAKGVPADERSEPVVSLGAAGWIPAEAVPEEDVRIALYARIAGIDDPVDANRFVEEFADRFGEPPEPVRVLADLAALKAAARRDGVARIDVGPDGVALTAGAAETPPGFARSQEGRLVKPGGAEGWQERIDLAASALEDLAAGGPGG